MLAHGKMRRFEILPCRMGKPATIVYHGGLRAAGLEGPAIYQRYEAI